jgi:hypothetical protein
MLWKVEGAAGIMVKWRGCAHWTFSCLTADVWRGATPAVEWELVQVSRRRGGCELSRRGGCELAGGVDLPTASKGLNVSHSSIPRF